MRYHFYAYLEDNHTDIIDRMHDIADFDLKITDEHADIGHIIRNNHADITDFICVIIQILLTICMIM